MGGSGTAMLLQDVVGISLTCRSQHASRAPMVLPNSASGRYHVGKAPPPFCPIGHRQQLAVVGTTANHRTTAGRHATLSRDAVRFFTGPATSISFTSSAAFVDGTGGVSGWALARPGGVSERSHQRGGPRGRTLGVRAAVFDQLTTSLEKVWEKLSTETTLTKENVKEPMQEIRRALLEADVSLPVVRRFVKNVSEKAVGTEVVRGVKPGQQLVKVVNDELVGVMGGKVAELEFARTGPTVILMAGLQGVGKTTACGKLALYLKKKEKKCLMVATDVYRPAAIDQLITLGEQVDVPVFSLGTDVKPPEIARRGLQEAKKMKADAVIVDTAGRLQVDGAMMDELKQIKAAVGPTEVLLVVDAMTGQEAAGLVAAFNQEVGITGAILTKVDGDSRGGAALSVYEVSGKPIKFVGEGEGMAALEPFYPDRMASRILGMGDVLTLVEKAQEMMQQEDAMAMTRRLMEEKFDFEDLLKQTKMMARMGSLGGLTKLIPGMNKVSPQQIKEAEKSLRIMESMIKSMTLKERRDPSLLAKSPSRRRRIALGSGRTQEQVSSLVAQLFSMRTQMKALMAGMPGMAPPGGPLKASPGKAKRKKSKSGFGAMLQAAKK